MAQNRFEPGIRVVGALFAATIGFGMKHILDASEGTMAIHKWPLFATSLVFFLKFLVGSSNHLWYEHIDNSINRHPNVLVILHITFLIIFGLFAAGMCYADSILQYHLIAILFLGIALAWNIVDFVVRRAVGDPPRGNWRFWIWTNLGHGALFAFSWPLHNTVVGSQIGFGWTWSWLVLFLGSSAILHLELVLQYDQLARDSA
jgi:hypothetical protein